MERSKVVASWLKSVLIQRKGMDLSGQSTSNVDRIAGAVAEAVRRTLTSGSINTQGAQRKLNNTASASIEICGISSIYAYTTVGVLSSSTIFHDLATP